MAILLIVLFFLLSSVKGVSAQIVINEFLADPENGDNGAEWVELYNLKNEAVSLAGCTLYLHESGQTQKVTFVSDDFIEKFKVVSWDGRWLNNAGDKIRFECPSINDSLIYGDLDAAVVTKPVVGRSIGRSPDGTGAFTQLAEVTLGMANSSPPTSTPTKTPTSTSSPKPTPSLTKTPTIKIVPLAKIESPTATHSPTKAKIMNTGTPEEIGSSDAPSPPTIYDLTTRDTNSIKGEIEHDKVESEVLGTKIANKNLALPIAFIATGIFTLLSAIYLFLRKGNKSYNLGDEENDE